MAKKCKLAFRWIKNETDSLVNKQKKWKRGGFK